MNPKPIELSGSPWLVAGHEALKRARQRAIEIAVETNTALVHVEDGKIVRVYPKADEPCE
ncbi:MAG: hypothetical protein ABW061_23690 [Polyangiaceae bacterium]